MNKKIPMGKRIGAIALCLSLLCGAIVGAGVLPLNTMSAQADTVNNVEKFEVDFADLAALVDNSSWDSSTNRYRPAETDTAIQNWMNSRFGLYLCRESSAYKPYSFLGQSSFATGAETSDGWSGEYWWEITKGGGLFSYTGGVGGQLLRKSNLLALKYDDGDYIQLTNFEANIVFSKADSKLGSVYLSFHQAEPGRMNTNCNNGTNTGNGTVAIIGNGPVGTFVNTTAADGHYRKAVKDGMTLGSLEGKDDRTMDFHFENDLEVNTDYNLYVKVVGKKMTVKVTKVADSAVVYSGETDIPEGSGYISVGTSNDKRVLKKIQVTELDKNGNAVNLGIARAFKWTFKGLIPYSGGKYQIGGSATNPSYDMIPSSSGVVNNNTESKSAVAAIDKAFDVYYNNEDKYLQMDPTKKAAYDGQSADFGWYRTLYIDKWVQRATGNTTSDPNGVAYDLNMRNITSLVPKVEGQALGYKNFEATMEVRFNNVDTTFLIGFRQQEAGKFVDAANVVNKEQAAVVLTKNGVSVAGGSGISDTMYNADVTKTFDSALTESGQYKMTVKAVGDQVTVKVTSLSGSTVYYEGTTTVNYTKAGYIAFAVANKTGDLGDITLTHLDDAGNRLGTTEFTEEEKALSAEPWTLSFVDLPGAEYVSGKYTKVDKNYVHFSSFDDTTAIDYISEKVGFYFNHEGNYSEVEPFGHNTSGSHNSGNWLLFYNKWLQRGGAEGSGERLRQINAIVPKDNNGVLAQTANLTATYSFRFENGDNGTGGPSTALFGFRQKDPAKFVNGHNNPNQQQVLVAITQKSIAVAGGTDITKERFYHYNQFADDDFGDVFTADLPQEITVTVEAVGKDVSVKIYNLAGTSLLYSGTFEVNYTDEGYMAFGMAAAGGNLGFLKVNRLDGNGNVADFTDDVYLEPTYPDGKKRFYANFTALSNKVDSYSGSYYAPTENDSSINNWINAKFGLFGMRESHLYSQLSYLGQLSSTWDEEAESKAAQWKIVKSGGVYASVAGAHNEMLRKTQNMVPKLESGELVKLQNFEAEVVFNKDGAHSFGALYVSFHEKVPGKFGFTWKGAAGSDIVDGVIVGNGDVNQGNKAVKDGITAGNVKDQNNKGMRTTFTENLDNSADYTLWVKVVGTKLDWSITKVGETTPVASGTETIAYTNAGYISIGARNRTIKCITITELNTRGEAVDFGTRGLGYNPENTTVYNFDSKDELADFESWYLPSTNGTNIPAIHTEGTTDDNWTVQDGALVFQQSSLYKTNEQMKEGVTFPQYNDYTYLDDRGWAGFASNHGIAVLKTKTFKNFILDVDVRVNGRWAPIGFGAKDYTDPNGVHATSANGGYSFHVETSANSTGTAKMWNYFADSETSTMHSSTSVTGYSSSNYNHFRIVVSDGVAMLYVNYSDAPVITYNLPDTYNGGYIYLTLNKAGNLYDNLKIVDLDKEAIVVTDIVTSIEDITINREDGEELAALPGNMTVADANGYEYDIAAAWVSDDYRSWKAGTSTFTFDPTAAWHNFDLSALAASITVTNNIGNDYNTANSRKYYFDHENDLLDFYQQESKHGYEYKGVYYDDYYSMYSGILVRNDDLFTIKNGKATQAKNATGMGSGWTELQAMRGVATAVLKDINLYNFQLEYDYTHSGMWYTYGLIGVQDPLSAHKQANWTDGYDFTDEKLDGSKKWANNQIGVTWRSGLGGGVWIHNEQEGYINMYGAIGGNSVRTTKNATGASISELYDKTVPHHITITVVDGLVQVMIDNDELLYTTYAAINEDALGGMVGFGSHRHGGTVDNFQITALDADGNPLDWADVEEGVDTGWAPTPIPDNYLGWKPKDDFVWGDEYEN